MRKKENNNNHCTYSMITVCSWFQSIYADRFKKQSTSNEIKIPTGVAAL